MSLILYMISPWLVYHRDGGCLQLIRRHNNKIYKYYTSAVGVATGYGLDGRRSIPGKSKIFLFFTTSRLTLGPTQWVPGAKRLESEADHSPPSDVEVKNGGAIPPLPPYVFMAWCLITFFNGTNSLHDVPSTNYGSKRFNIAITNASHCLPTY
jgi:hypothetical protein